MSKQIDWKTLKMLQNAVGGRRDSETGPATTNRPAVASLTAEERAEFGQHIELRPSQFLAALGGAGFDASLSGYHEFGHHWGKEPQEAQIELERWMATHDWRKWCLQIDRMVAEVSRAVDELKAEVGRISGDKIVLSIRGAWIGQRTFEPTWTVEIVEMRHEDLHKQRLIRLGDAWTEYFRVLEFGSGFDTTRWAGLRDKILTQAEQWSRAWERMAGAEEKKVRKLHIEYRQKQAAERSAAARSELARIRQLLRASIQPGFDPNVPEQQAGNSAPERYEPKSAAAVLDRCEQVLASSKYPECFPREHQLDFNSETGVLVLNFRLPAPGDLPTVYQIRYSAANGEFVETHLSAPEQARLYDDVVYQVALRTFFELFGSGDLGVLSAIVFNGFVTSIDRGTGHEVMAFIISVQVSRPTFQSLNLAKVDPRACFRQLNGTGSSQLHSITPIAPIIDLRRDDPRFIAAQSVANKLHEGFNLAAMDWEDFEHLIREIFEKEFSSVGGEVKVTQASRDRGVDAVVFDPDPIRGGKLIIQAKRYAFTVDVSAVRDLYGTILNEGATKGILVTTSDYGPDAYEFADGKPITLLNGSNLLHLLQKHGVKAHIDLAEARKTLGVRLSM